MIGAVLPLVESLECHRPVHLSGEGYAIPQYPWMGTLIPVLQLPLDVLLVVALNQKLCLTSLAWMNEVGSSPQCFGVPAWSVWFW